MKGKKAAIDNSRTSNFKRVKVPYEELQVICNKEDSLESEVPIETISYIIPTSIFSYIGYLSSGVINGYHLISMNLTLYYQRSYQNKVKIIKWKLEQVKQSICTNRDGFKDCT